MNTDSLVTAAITAADIATAGMAQVTVVNPTPGGGISNAHASTITGLALDASTPSTVKNNTQTLTTASFTPPAESVLYICVLLNIPRVLRLEKTLSVKSRII
ncbi:MAG: hypothetical protein ABR903_03335 [Thermodesulfovibrionales bacterium]